PILHCRSTKSRHRSFCQGGGGLTLTHVPMTLKRRSGRKEIVVPDGLEHSGGTGPDYHEALVIATSRAHRWKKLLDEGKYGSIIEMAQALKIDRHRMARMLRLTLLSPDIIEAILAGNEPDGFSLRQLVGEIPVLWDEQIEKYGFTAANR
ncbi:MAG: hypothetical protein ACP5R5_13085, partial [Armatimonadota bacterium]